MRSATARAVPVIGPGPTNRMANSSPPILATVSLARASPARMAPTFCSRRSP